jgi:RNA-binding protein 26
MPFINRLFAKIKGTDSNANVPSSHDRFNEFSDDEDDGDRNFKHRRQRSNSRDEQQDRGSKRRLPEQDNQNGSSNKYFRAGANEDSKRSNNNPNSIPITGYNGGHFDNNRGRGASSRGGRGGRGGSNMNRGSRPQCRDYNGMFFITF